MTKDTAWDILGWAAIGIACVLIVMFCWLVPPIVIIWCLNTLFKTDIEINSYTILAVMIGIVTIRLVLRVGHGAKE